MSLKPGQDPQELILDDTDWVVFYTQAKTTETEAIVEVIMIENDILKGTNRAKGIGYARVKVFDDGKDDSVKIYKGSPRDILKYAGEIGNEPPETNSTLYFEVKKVPPKTLDWLMNLIPDNTLVGSTDIIPGIKNSILPKKLLEIGKPEFCSPVEV